VGSADDREKARKEALAKVEALKNYAPDENERLREQHWQQHGTGPPGRHRFMDPPWAFGGGRHPMIRRGAHLRHMVGRMLEALVRQRRDEIGMAEVNARREIVKHARAQRPSVHRTVAVHFLMKHLNINQPRLVTPLVELHEGWRSLLADERKYGSLPPCCAPDSGRAGAQLAPVLQPAYTAMRRAKHLQRWARVHAFLVDAGRAPAFPTQGLNQLASFGPCFNFMQSAAEDLERELINAMAAAEGEPAAFEGSGMELPYNRRDDDPQALNARHEIARRDRLDREEVERQLKALDDMAMDRAAAMNPMRPGAAPLLPQRPQPNGRYIPRATLNMVVGLPGQRVDEWFPDYRARRKREMEDVVRRRNAEEAERVERERQEELEERTAGLRKLGDALRARTKLLIGHLDSCDEAMHAAFGTAKRLVTMEMPN